jgi:DNA-binding NarL/FixJ family response regulator
MTAEQAVEYARSKEELAPLAQQQPLPDEPSIALTPREEETDPPTTYAPELTSFDRRSSLTRREKQIANLVAQGLSNRQIAQELVISERTVHAHVYRILKKLNLRSREQVAPFLGDHVGYPRP